MWLHRQYFLPFMAEKYSIVCIDHIFFVRSPTDEGCFHILPLSSCTKDESTDIFLIFCFHFLSFPSDNLRSETAGSYRGPTVNFLRNFHTVIHSSCTNLRSHQQFPRIFFLSHPRQHLSSLIFLTMSILIGVRWYFSVVLICISQTQFLNRQKLPCRVW